MTFPPNESRATTATRAAEAQQQLVRVVRTVREKAGAGLEQLRQHYQKQRLRWHYRGLRRHLQPADSVQTRLRLKARKTQELAQEQHDTQARIVSRTAQQPAPAHSSPRGSLFKALARRGEAQRSAQAKVAAQSAKRAQRKHGILLRPTSLHSKYFLEQALRYWQIALLTLPFDFLLAALPLHGLSPHANGAAASQTLGSLSVGTLLVALLFCFGDLALRILDRVRQTQELLQQRFAKLALYGFILLACCLVVEIALRVSSTSLSPTVLAMGLLALAFGARSLLREWRSHHARRAQLTRDKIFWIEQVNQQNFGCVLLPIVLARSAALFAALKIAFETSAASQEPALPLFEVYQANMLPSALSYAAFFFAVLLMLLTLKPHSRQFGTSCKGCARTTSRALSTLGYCPACAPAEFVLVEEQQHMQGANRG